MNILLQDSTYTFTCMINHDSYIIVRKWTKRRGGEWKIVKNGKIGNEFGKTENKIIDMIMLRFCSIFDLEENNEDNI